MIEINGLGHLMSLVNSTSKVTVIDFYADWCGPCQQIKPQYEQMARYFDPAKVVCCKCNVDRNRDCASHFSITAMPTFVVCLGGETINTVRGGDLGLVQRYVDMATNMIASEAAAAADRGNGSSSGGAAAGAAAGTVHDAFARAMLHLTAAVKEKNQIAQKDACDAAYKLLIDSTFECAGVLLIPYLASEAFSAVALDALLRSIALRSNTERCDGESMVNEVLRFIVEVAGSTTWEEPDTARLLVTAVVNLVQSSAAQPLVVRSPIFDNTLIANGVQLERFTLLGALLGIGPDTRAFPSMDANITNWQTVMKLFPAAEPDHSQKVYEVQQAVSLMFDINNHLVQALLRCKETRPATLLFLGKALQVNEGYFKTMFQSERLSSRFFMAQLCAILIEAALPIFAKGEFDYAKLPSYYVLQGDDNPTVVAFGGEDTERIVHYDEARPCPAYPADAEPYKPFVHLFFLAARAMTFVAAFIDMHERDARQARHPQVGQRERDALTAEKCLYEALLEPQKLALSRLQLLNYMAKWLLHLMQVRPDGSLPAQVPEQWNCLPQQLVDTVIRATQMAPKDGLFIDGMLSLTLVLMGNTDYFPKPHTHTLFPSYLMDILRDYTTRKVLEAHPWFTDHIVRSCIHCYIAVEKSIYERVQVRYELAHCLRQFLQVDSLCDPVRDEFGKEGTVLERFSHMAVAEVNQAVDQLIETLMKMNELLKSGADLSENAAAPPAAAGGGANDDNTTNNATPGNANRNRNRRQGNRAGASTANNEEDDGEEDDDEEEEEQADGTRTYHQLGLDLRSNIMLFNASIDMFNQIAEQFTKGVSQNMVAQQISQMLSRSLVCFAGPKSKSLKIEHAERYEYRPREILSRLVDCITRFRRSRSFLHCMCQCGVPLTDITAAMTMVVERQLVTEDLSWRLSEMMTALQTVSVEVDEEDALWEDAPDFALDALLSTPLLHPVALPSEVKDLEDLVYVNSDTIHHLLLSESKHPFTKEYLDEAMVKEFNEKPEIKEAREAVQKKIKEWMAEQKQNGANKK